MWPVPLIIGVAVAGAVVLLVTGIILAVGFERRRHRRLLREHGVMSDLTACHRTQLSANEENYSHIPPPKSGLRRWSYGILTGSCDAFPPTAHLKPPGSSMLQHPELTEPARRGPSLRQTLYGPPFRVPKTQGPDKSILLKQVPHSPLSAITEFADSTGASSPVISELPATISPRKALGGSFEDPFSRPSARATLSVPKPRFRNPDSNEGDETTNLPQAKHIATSLRTRSPSTTSTISIAPDDPLPPLPYIDVYRYGKQQNLRWRTSTTSIETTGSSVLESALPRSAAEADDSRVSQLNLNSDLQSFDFGLIERRAPARLGIPAGRVALDGFCSGQPGIASIRPSMEFNPGRGAAASEEFTRPQSNEGDIGKDSLKTIDAGSWTLLPAHGLPWRSEPGKMNARHSMYEKSSSIGRRNPYLRLQDLSRSDQEFAQPIAPRPASVASEHPFQWDSRPLFCPDRRSLGSKGSLRKGHRRQNCVRITNLPSIDVSKTKKTGPMPEVQEEPVETTDAMTDKIPDPIPFEGRAVVSQARASSTDATGSPLPLKSRHDAQSSNWQKQRFGCVNAENGLMVEDLRQRTDEFNTSQPYPTAPKIPVTSSTQRSPWSPTLSTPVDTGPKRTKKTASQQLYPSARESSRRSQVKGPRNLPGAGILIKAVPLSPAIDEFAFNQRSVEESMRKSVMLLRSMNSEARLLDQNSRMYRYIGGDGMGGSTHSPIPSSGNLLAPEKRNGWIGMTSSRSKLSMAISPSVMSVDGVSIWEDASVRGDSPEPDLPPLMSMDWGDHQPRTPVHPVDPEAYENYDQFPISWKALAPRNKFSSPQGKGLGLHAGNVVLGTPGSLYDGDGFLKE